MIICLATHPAQDLSKVAKSLANNYGMQYNEFDENSIHKNTNILKNTSNMVTLGHVVSHRLEGDVVRVYVKYSDEFLARQYMDQMNVNFDLATKTITDIESSKKEFLTKFFGIDLNDLKVYDLIIRADRLDRDGLINVIDKYVSKLKRE